MDKAFLSPLSYILSADAPKSKISKDSSGRPAMSQGFNKPRGQGFSGSRGGFGNRGGFNNRGSQGVRNNSRGGFQGRQ